MSVRRVALTGGIGTGKSHVLARVRRRGVPVVDADELARAALAPGAPAVGLVTARFGADLVDAGGTLDRRRLAAIVFSDAAARRDLEQIIHPGVVAAISDWFARLGSASGPTWAMADVPLLFEAGLETEFDHVIATICPEPIQIRRVMERDGVSEAEVRARMAAQLPAAVKAERADLVIRTGGRKEDTDRQVDQICDALDGER